MEDILELLIGLVYLSILRLADLIYRNKDRTRNPTRINRFRIGLAALGLFCLQKPLLRMAGFAVLAAGYHLTLPVVMVVDVAFLVGLLMLAAGEGHHDTGWNHRRGWWAVLVATGIGAIFVAVALLNPAR